MNHTTELTDESEIYDSIQMGVIPKIKMGDTINGKYIIVDKIGNFTEIKEGEAYFLFTETVKNNSTKETFTESYISTNQQPFGPGCAHLEVIEVEKSSPITLMKPTLVRPPNSLRTVEMTPRFQHDCNHCVFLGTVNINTTFADIYFHKSKNDVTIIARTDDEGSEYCSSPLWISPLNQLLYLGMSMYINHLEVNSYNGTRISGSFYKNGELVLKLA